MLVPGTRLTLLILAVVATAAGIAVAAVLTLSARGGDEVSLEGITITEIDLGGAKLLVPNGDPVLSADQAEAIVLGRWRTRFGDDLTAPEARETRLLRFVNETLDPPIDALAWAVNLAPGTVPAVTPCPGFCIGPLGWVEPTPTPVPTPLNCGPGTVYDIVFIDARTGEWLYEANSTELVVPEPGATCPPGTPTVGQTETPTRESDGSGAPPPKLVQISRELPRPADAVVDGSNIYTGGSVLQTIYWSKQGVADVFSFYEERMSVSGWETVSVTRFEIPADEKSAESTAGIAVFHRGSTTVSVSVVENTVKDPGRGTTRIGIAIEDRNLDS